MRDKHQAFVTSRPAKVIYDCLSAWEALAQAQILEQRHSRFPVDVRLVRPEKCHKGPHAPSEELLQVLAGGLSPHSKRVGFRSFALC